MTDDSGKKYLRIHLAEISGPVVGEAVEIDGATVITFDPTVLCIQQANVQDVDITIGSGYFSLKHGIIINPEKYSVRKEKKHD